MNQEPILSFIIQFTGIIIWPAVMIFILCRFKNPIEHLLYNINIEEINLLGVKLLRKLSKSSDAFEISKEAKKKKRYFEKISKKSLEKAIAESDKLLLDTSKTALAQTGMDEREVQELTQEAINKKLHEKELINKDEYIWLNQLRSTQWVAATNASTTIDYVNATSNFAGKLEVISKNYKP